MTIYRDQERQTPNTFGILLTIKNFGRCVKKKAFFFLSFFFLEAPLKKIKQPYDPAIPLLSIYPEKIIIQKNTCTPAFIAAPFTIARTMEAT